MDKNINEMTPAEALKYIRGLYGMKRSEFCEHFGIPLRSLQHWEIGDRKPAPFLIFLVCKVYDLEQENMRLQECIDMLDRQNDELKSLIRGGADINGE
jgi:transcriptional regulator with XRE-family HTH domain